MNKTERLYLVFKIFTLVLSVLIIVSGILLAISAANMYFTGGNTPYTRARVGEYLLKIIIPLIATVVIAVATAVISLILPKDEAAGRPPVDEGKALRRLYSRYTLTANADGRSLYLSGKGDRALRATDEAARIIKKAKAMRLISLTVTAVLTLGAAVSAIIFSTDAARYSIESINGSVISVCLFVIPLSVLVLCCIIALFCLFRLTYRTELEAVKETVKINDKADAYEGARCPIGRVVDSTIAFIDKHDFIITATVRALVLSAAVAFIILGVFNGGALETFGKAARLCMECVGIG